MSPSRRYAFAVIVAALRAATEAGTLQVDDPETVTPLLLGALTRGAMLIANSTDPVGTRHAVALSMRTFAERFHFAGLELVPKPFSRHAIRVVHLHALRRA